MVLCPALLAGRVLSLEIRSAITAALGLTQAILRHPWYVRESRVFRGRRDGLRHDGARESRKLVRNLVFTFFPPFVWFLAAFAFAFSLARRHAPSHEDRNAAYILATVCFSLEETVVFTADFALSASVLADLIRVVGLAYASLDALRRVGAG